MSEYQSRVFGQYTLVDRIASGGMAEIFLAHTRGYSGFEKTIVVKRLHPHLSEDTRFVEMLVDEAKITVQLQHGNIVQIFDLGHVDGHYYIAMEYVDGRDLFAVLRELHDRGLQLPVEAAAFIAMEMCHGLHFAHTSRHHLTGEPLEVVHRDISPQNILMSWSGEVKIADFGIVKARQRMTHTEAGVIKGKFYYMSPEQAKGEPIDYRSDIFSAGIVLWEALTATPLYDEVDDSALMKRVQSASVVTPRTHRSDVPPELERICMKSLTANPDQRWRSARDMARALATFLNERQRSFTKLDLGECLRALFDDHDTNPGMRLPTGATSEPPPIPADASIDSANLATAALDLHESTRPLRPLAASTTRPALSEPPTSIRMPGSALATSSKDGAGSGDPFAQTRRLSLDDIRQASAHQSNTRLQPAPALSMSPPAAPPEPAPAVRDRLGDQLKVAIGLVVAVDIVLALIIAWLVLNPVEIPTASAERSVPAATAAPPKAPTPAAPKAEPKPADKPSADDNRPAALVVVRPASAERLKLYLNGELTPLNGDRVSVLPGRYSVRARLLPSGKLTKEQVVNLAPGAEQRLTF